MFFDDTSLAPATTQLRRKTVNGLPATTEQLDRLEAIRRLLLKVDAIRAVLAVDQRWGRCPQQQLPSWRGRRKTLDNDNAFGAAGVDGADPEAKGREAWDGLVGRVNVGPG